MVVRNGSLSCRDIQRYNRNTPVSKRKREDLGEQDRRTQIFDEEKENMISVEFQIDLFRESLGVGLIVPAESLYL